MFRRTVLTLLSASRPKMWALHAAWLCLALWLVVGLRPAELDRAQASDRVPSPQLKVMVGLATLPMQDLEAEARALVHNYLAHELTLKREGQSLRVPRRDLGIRVDVDTLVDRLIQAKNPTSAMRRLHAKSDPSRPLRLPMPAHVDTEAGLSALLAMKDRLDRHPRNARIATDTRELLPHHDGFEMDVWGTLDAIDRAARRGDNQALLVGRVTAAERTEEAVGDVDMKTVLSTFTTRYNPGESAEDRTFNLKVAASKVDGTILMPGETFDFNRVVGERSEANGFRAAGVIAGGELTEDAGGGTCQISGTLHGAVFFGGLDIVERHPHSRPSFYIKLGLDAAVAWPNLNFRFRNNTAKPLVLGMRVEFGRVTATIWGSEQEKNVTFVRRIDQLTPFEDLEREDPTLPEGVRVLSQRGIPGFGVKRMRVLRDEATNRTVRRALKFDIYPPTTQIWRVGTGPAASEDYEPPAGDDHPEYVADEYMTMRWTEVGQDFDEYRWAGKTGTYGWTVREGMGTPIQPEEETAAP